jgi:hypothetical protein
MPNLAGSRVVAVTNAKKFLVVSVFAMYRCAPQCQHSSKKERGLKAHQSKCKHWQAFKESQHARCVTLSQTKGKKRNLDAVVVQMENTEVVLDIYAETDPVLRPLPHPTWGMPVSIPAFSVSTVM